MQKDILYGSEMSYFSGKARAYLRWKELPFEEIAPTPEIMKADILPRIGWPVIPVLKTHDGTYVQDTSEIIDYMEARHTARPVFPGGAVQTFFSLLLQLFADEWLVLPAMHYRWNHNEDWILLEFGKTALPNGSIDAQRQAGAAIGSRFRGFVPVLGITPDTIPVIESAYESFLSDFSTHLGVMPYVFGERASFADFCLIGPLYAHQYRDKTTGEHMRRTAPKVADWVERVISGQGKNGALLSDDMVPETLLPILKVQAAEQIPYLQKTRDLFNQWASTAKTGEDVPRGFDLIDFTTGGQNGKCLARSFPLYRLQQALDALSASSPSERARIHAVLTSIGADGLIDFRFEHRLGRRNYKLVLAEQA